MGGVLRSIGVPYFHATDFYTRGGLYRGVDPAKIDRAAPLLPELINDHVRQVVGVSFKTKEYAAVVPAEWRKRHGGLYPVAVQLCLDALGHLEDQRRSNEPIHYFLESGDPEQSRVDDILNMRRLKNEARGHTRYKSHAFAAKGQLRGLEASDFFAWHWNKYYAETLATQLRPMRKDFQALIRRDPRKYRMYLFTGAELEYFLSDKWGRPPAPDEEVPDRPRHSIASVLRKIERS